MLEIINLSKTYILKKGVSVKAIDDVSLNIEDKGMVFILGKSGSGKSTFLNLIGGLDKYDQGEIKIYGKSTKDFSQADFDSYRNTFVGFIFQEYNILEEFTVKQNVALAIQLQGKKLTDERLYEILEEVDLEEYANRRPNELSGGQLQRVAIARALVKNPEIIMADEPTGALDSKTGIQVFDTLKKISKEKLVIVVSHDREFAEKYADRIVELADGKIISDVKKIIVTDDYVKEAKLKALSMDEDNKLHIKKGFKLTSKDRALINFYIEKSSKKDAEIIYDDVKEDVQETDKLDDKGNKIAFIEKDSAEILANEANKELVNIKSALPFKNSLRIGANSLKVKLFRLIITIILSTSAFTMFGVVATFADFKIYNSMSSTIIDNQIDYINIQKEVDKVSPSALVYTNKGIGTRDIENISQINSNSKFLKVYSGIDGLGVYFSGLGKSKYVYYRNGNLSGMTEVDMTKEEFLSTYGFTMTGELPKADNEVVITKFLYEHFKKAGFPKDGYNKLITSENDLIGESIYVYSTYMKITGIVDTNLSADYEKLKTVEYSTNYKDKDILNSIKMFNNDIKYGFHYLAYVNNGYIEKNVTDNKYVINEDNIELDIIPYSKMPDELKAIKSSKFFLEKWYLNMASQNYTKVFFDKGKSQLEADEILLPYGALGEETHQQILRNIDQGIIDYCNKIENVPQAIKDMNRVQLIDAFDLEDHYQYYCENEVPTQSDYSNAFYCWMKHFSSNDYGDRNQIIKQINNEKIAEAFLSVDNIQLYFKKSGFQTMKNLKVVGYLLKKYEHHNIYFSGNDFNYNYFETISTAPNNFDYYSANYEVLISEGLMNELGLETFGIYNSLLGNVPNAEKEIANLTKSIYTYAESGDSYIIYNDVSEKVNEINEVISYVINILLYITIGLAVFAMVLMMNYISTSISYKKKEIGVLRALGARGIDVFGIFFNEAMIIAALNSVISIVASFFAILGTNLFYRSKVFMNITVFNFGILQILLILGASVVAASLASFLPVYLISKKRPIESIRNK